MKVKDIMIREVKTLSPDMSVKDAALKLFLLQISGLPVVDSEGHILGMFTEKELIRLTLPNYIEQAGEFAYMLDTDGFEKKAGELDKIKVSDAMRKEVVCISEDTPFPEAVRLMITKKIRRIPVVKENKLIGIIARSDIVEEIIKQYRILE